MSGLLKYCAVALAAAVAMPLAALGAAPDNLDVAAPPKPAPALIVPLEHQMDTEMVVRDWVLCVSQAFAETIAKARAIGPAEALAAYSDLKASKSCGQFSELRVVLHKPLYAADGTQEAAQVFSAAVNISGRWANAFVIEGGLPEDR